MNSPHYSDSCTCGNCCMVRKQSGRKSIRCSRERAEHLLSVYDMRRKGGYKNQEIAAREQLRLNTGLGVRDLRKWLAGETR